MFKIIENYKNLFSLCIKNELDNIQNSPSKSKESTYDLINRIKNDWKINEKDLQDLLSLEEELKNGEDEVIKSTKEILRVAYYKTLSKWFEVKNEDWYKVLLMLIEIVDENIKMPEYSTFENLKKGHYDELKSSMKKLKLEKEDKVYFDSFTIVYDKWKIKVYCDKNLNMWNNWVLVWIIENWNFKYDSFWIFDPIWNTVLNDNDFYIRNKTLKINSSQIEKKIESSIEFSDDASSNLKLLKNIISDWEITIDEIKKISPNINKIKESGAIDWLIQIANSVDKNWFEAKDEKSYNIFKKFLDNFREYSLITWEEQIWFIKENLGSENFNISNVHWVFINSNIIKIKYSKSWENNILIIKNSGKWEWKKEYDNSTFSNIWKVEKSILDTIIAEIWLNWAVKIKSIKVEGQSKTKKTVEAKKIMKPKKTDETKKTVKPKKTDETKKTVETKKIDETKKTTKIKKTEKVTDLETQKLNEAKSFYKKHWANYEKIKLIQEALIKKWETLAKYGNDWKFWKEMYDAIISFQKKNNIKIDWKAWNKTLKDLWLITKQQTSEDFYKNILLKQESQNIDKNELQDRKWLDELYEGNKLEELYEEINSKLDRAKKESYFIDEKNLKKKWYKDERPKDSK